MSGNKILFLWIVLKSLRQNKGKKMIFKKQDVVQNLSLLNTTFLGPSLKYASVPREDC